MGCGPYRPSQVESWNLCILRSAAVRAAWPASPSQWWSSSFGAALQRNSTQGESNHHHYLTSALPLHQQRSRPLQGGIPHAKSYYSVLCGVKGTCQYPFNRSSLVINTAEPILSIQSSICGNGKESGTVTALTSLKSVQKRGVPSAVGASKHGELHELLLGSARPFSSK